MAHSHRTDMGTAITLGLQSSWYITLAQHHHHVNGRCINISRTQSRFKIQSLKLHLRRTREQETRVDPLLEEHLACASKYSARSCHMVSELLLSSCGAPFLLLKALVSSIEDGSLVIHPLWTHDVSILKIIERASTRVKGGLLRLKCSQVTHDLMMLVS